MLLKTFKFQVFLFGLFVSSYATAQYGKITWQNTYPFQTVSIGYGLTKGVNGGYAMAGQSYVTSQLSGQATAIRVNDNGALLSQFIMPDTVQSRFHAMATASDGYIACGYRDTTTTNSLLVMKFDTSLSPVWTKTFDGLNEDIGMFVQQTFDGGYIVAARSSSYDLPGSHGAMDTWLLKLDAAGNLMWQKLYGGSGHEITGSVKQTADSGFIIVSGSYSNNGDVVGNHGNSDVWVVKTDVNGNITWKKCFGGTGFDFGMDIIQSSDGNYVATALTSSINGDVTGLHASTNMPDIWVLKISSAGNLIWQKVFGGYHRDESYRLVEATPGNYTIVGSGQAPTAPDGDLLCPTPMESLKAGWIISINDTGGMVWQHQFYGGTWGGLAPTGDGGYIVGGIYSDDLQGSMWLARIDTASVFECDSLLVALEVPAVVGEEDIKVYPTTSNGIINVDLPEGCKDAEVKMYNMLGSAVSYTEAGNNKLSRKLLLGDVPQGMYILVVTNGVSRRTFKVIYQP